MADLETKVERWLAEARERCVPSMAGTDLDWLSGRVRAFLDVLTFVRDGRDVAPPESLPVPDE